MRKQIIIAALLTLLASVAHAAAKLPPELRGPWCGSDNNVVGDRIEYHRCTARDGLIVKPDGRKTQTFKIGTWVDLAVPSWRHAGCLPGRPVGPEFCTPSAR